MPSVSLSVFLAVQAAALSALFVAPFTPASAMASPMPMPFPLMGPDYHAASHHAGAQAKNGTRKSTRVKHVAVRNDTKTSSATRRALPAALVNPGSNVSPKHQRANADDSDSYNKMNDYYNAASTHSKNLSTYIIICSLSLAHFIIESLAAQSSSVQNDDSDFHQQAASQLTGFHTQLLGFESILQQIGSDKGLKNYDRTNQFETLLKKVVNLNKDTLSSITTISYNLPIVGTTLGPSKFFPFFL